MINYSANGNIERWLLYHNNVPFCEVLYKKDGSFSTLRGHAILDTLYKPNGDIAVPLIAPPNLNYILVFGDFYKGIMVNRSDYDPVKTDSINWVVLGKLNYVPSHKYKLFFCKEDTTLRKISLIDSIELKNLKD